MNKKRLPTQSTQKAGRIIGSNRPAIIKTKRQDKQKTKLRQNIYIQNTMFMCIKKLQNDKVMMASNKT